MRQAPACQASSLLLDKPIMCLTFKPMGTSTAAFVDLPCQLVPRCSAPNQSASPPTDGGVTRHTLHLMHMLDMR